MAQETQELPVALMMAETLEKMQIIPAAAELRRQNAEIERLKAQEGELCMLYALEQAECRKLRTELAVLRRSLSKK